ncbi:glycerol-3-phosphate acyltransferase [uncultured Gemella sp.]|uniref:glycerol-3-phosphate acyltransferase n=1 Tax=uncultured Gemella sp. TaxID=254352 RepID=UPI0028D3BB0A|nr:glycerol-3-phosphate acyltransferase [uncultured Gemella sp.]
MITMVIYAIIAYLLGNVMGGKLLEKIYKEEFTNKGSGNVGARNAGRVLGPRSFLFVLAVDFFKGFFVVILLKILNVEPKIIYICIVLVLLGHIKPIIFKFKGGKGVATFFGCLAALSLNLFLIMILCTLVIAIIVKSLTIGFYSSLPFVTYINYVENPSFLILGIFILALLLLSVVAVKDIEESFNKYFSVRKVKKSVR